MPFSSTFSFYLKINEKSTVNQMLLRLRIIDISLYLEYNNNNRGA